MEQLIINIGAELFLATSLSVSNATVSQVTTLTFQLFLNTQTAQSGDYLSFILPSSISFKTTTTPTCSMSPVSISTCKIISSSMGNITLSTISSSSSITSLQGSISNFQNPDSTISISTIEIDLYSSAGLLKASTSTASLSSFQVATNTGSLSSSSIIVGDTSAILSVSITPSTKIKSSGIVIITVPTYYTNAGSNYIIGSTTPTCTGTNGISVTSCIFVQSSKQITIIYSASSDITATTVFTISNFKNPITPQTLSGFTVLTLDSSGNNIGYISALSLSGVSVPTSFSAEQVSIQGTTSIGEYTTIQLTLSLSVPVQQYCYLKFVFPSDFTVDTALVSLSGTGFFTASLTTQSIPWISKDTTTQTIIIEACQIYYGMNQVGQITFYQIKNPVISLLFQCILQGYVKGTGSIKVYLAADSSFNYMISQITSNFIVSASQFNPGSINSISVSAVDSLQVQTLTSYSFTFTPVHDMKPSGAVIVIVFPSSITLSSSGKCSVTSQSSTFDSPSISCSASGQQITVTSPFSQTYTGGTQLQLTLANGTNPISVKDAGTFSITTYISVGGSLYNVDSGSISNQITPTGGWIHKGSDIVASNYQTYMKGTAYTFYLLFQHSVPVNGIIRILIPSQISISDKNLIKTTCIRTDTSMSATCSVVSSTEIDVTLDSGSFPNGFPASQTLPLYMAGFQNPRTTAPTDEFYFYSTDSSGYSIDESSSSDYFTLTMTTMGSIAHVSAGMLNALNGNITTYTITFVPNTPLYSGDQFLIKFPPEVTLPISTNLACNTTQGTKISKLSCDLISSSYLQVNLITVINIIVNDQVTFNVYNVKNPISTQPTSAFSNIQLQTSSGYFISQYTNTDVTVTTTSAATIYTGKLTQSNQNPRSNALYTITFTTFDSLPPATAFIVITPLSITLNSTNKTCYLQTTSVVNNVCIISEGLIQIVNGFISNSINYAGEVKIVFQAINPSDNTDTESIIFRSYTDSTFAYRIDKIETGLVPTLYCNYPCQTCSQNDPSFCTSCFTTDYTLPQILQMYPNGTQTCAYSCLEGYTTNGSKNPKQCTNCDPKCKICAETGSSTDYKTCITCSKSYPFYYADTLSCQDSCYNGTYKCTSSSCCDCKTPCKNCLSDTQCTSCYPQYNTSLYLFQSNQCVASCDIGKTAVGSQCVACNSPCGTCDQGFPDSCLTCDSLSANQFLFGRQCVSTCPNGTTLNYDYRRCDGCESSCTKCNDNNNAICLACISGLLLYNNSCISQCPDQYIKSFDGSTCEIRPYLLDGSLIYFPFGTAAGVILLICLMSTAITCGKSLLLTNSIALLSLVEMASVAMVFYQSYQKEYVLIQFGAAGIIGIQILFNTLFLIYYCCKLQYLDVTFNYWRQKYPCSMILILVFSSMINFKTFRLIYGRLFGLKCLSALIEQHNSFFKPIIAFSMVSIITFTAPVCVLGSIVIYRLTWGTQLYITVLECCGVSFISGLLMLFEHCPCCCINQYAPKSKKKIPPKDNYNKIEDANSYMIDQEQQQQKELIDIDVDERQERVRRKDVLKNILQTVKNNKDLNMNNFLDHDQEEGEEAKSMRRVQSSKELQMYQFINGDEMKGEDDRKVSTYPNSPNLNSYDMPAQTLWFDNINMRENDKDRIKHIKKTIENMQTEFKFDNVFAESRPQKIIKEEAQVKEQFDMEIQTEVTGVLEKRSDKGSAKSVGSSSPKSKIKSKQAMDDRQAQDSMDQFEESNQSRKGKKKNQQRGKRNNAYYTQIDEEDEDDNFSGGEDQNMEGFKTVQDQQQLGVIVEDEEGDIINIKGKTLYKIDQQEEFKLLDDLPSERVGLRDQNLESEYFNQRTFNVNDICGEFKRDNKGIIIHLHETLRNNQFKDDERKDCNDLGYVIDKYSGDIINKYSFNRMFRYEDLVHENQIPLLYRIEAHNFNPHEIFGNFDYDKQSEKPIILKNKQGQLVDKNLRNVNSAGYLVDPKGNIIDNQGRLKFMRHQQTEKGDLLKLYNYKGKSYSIRDIVGVFRKNNQTKDIIFEKKKSNNNKNKQTLTDKLGRLVNQKGYLLDSLGNIINKQGKIVFRKHTILFNEPPKFFTFSYFNIDDISGKFNYDQFDEPIIEFSPFHGGPRDLEDRLVNLKGYLIDDDGNIVDQTGKMVFYKDILEDFKSEKVEIPKVFRCGVMKGVEQNDYGYDSDKDQQLHVQEVQEVEQYADQDQDIQQDIISNHPVQLQLDLSEKKLSHDNRQQEFTLSSPKKSIESHPFYQRPQSSKHPTEIVLSQDDGNRNTILSNSIKFPLQSDISIKSPPDQNQQDDTSNYHLPKSISKWSLNQHIQQDEPVYVPSSHGFQQDNNVDYSQYEQQERQADEEYYDQDQKLQSEYLYKINDQWNAQQEQDEQIDCILPKKKLKQQQDNIRKERLRSAYQPMKPPKQKAPRAKSSQRPSFQRIKNTTTPFDYKQAADPFGYVRQDKAKERLAKLAHSLSGLNQTDTFKMGSFNDLNQFGNRDEKRKNLRSGKTDSVLGRSGNYQLKQVMKNKYVYSNEGDSNSQGDTSYNQYLNNDIDISNYNH